MNTNERIITTEQITLIIKYLNGIKVELDYAQGLLEIRTFMNQLLVTQKAPTEEIQTPVVAE